MQHIQSINTFMNCAVKWFNFETEMDEVVEGCTVQVFDIGVFKITDRNGEDPFNPDDDIDLLSIETQSKSDLLLVLRNEDSAELTTYEDCTIKLKSNASGRMKTLKNCSVEMNSEGGIRISDRIENEVYLEDVELVSIMNNEHDDILKLHDIERFHLFEEDAVLAQ